MIFIDKKGKEALDKLTDTALRGSGINAYNAVSQVYSQVKFNEAIDIIEPPKDEEPDIKIEEESLLTEDVEPMKRKEESADK